MVECGPDSNSFYSLCSSRQAFLDASTALANALISSRIDYHNSLLHSIPEVHLNKLQRVQSSLAGVVSKSTRFTSSRPLLDRLHWLLTASRIDFKIATLTDKAVHLKQPPSLAQHLKLKSIHFNTQNNDQLLLQHSSVGTNNYRRPAFSYTAPTVWNKLSYKIRNVPSVTLFRKELKTLYFVTASKPSDGRIFSVRRSDRF